MDTTRVDMTQRTAAQRVWVAQAPERRRIAAHPAAFVRRVQESAEQLSCHDREARA
jgi:hypothetical protein